MGVLNKLHMEGLEWCPAMALHEYLFNKYKYNQARNHDLRNSEKGKCYF
jgi:hypothetical protein